MKINLKNGIDRLLFGMKSIDVEKIYGKPDRFFSDEEGNMIYLYNLLKLRLTFYQDEAFRLGYIITSNKEAALWDKKIIGLNCESVKNDLPIKKLGD